MTEIRIQPFKLLGEAEAEERLRQFVTHYKPFAMMLPCVTSFEENGWDLRGKYFQAIAGNQKLTIRFLKMHPESQRKATQPLDQPFLDFAKAYTLHLMATIDWHSIAVLKASWLPLLRYIEHGLCMARPLTPPCITYLTEDLCETINASIRTSAFGANKKYDICLALNMLVESLQELGLCARRFTWTGMAVRLDETHRRVGPEGDKARTNLLPSPEAMAAMAYCFDHAEGPREKWLSAINALLSGQPARLGECWFLREDYWVETEVQGQRRFGMKWWPQKKAKPLVKEFLADDTFVPVFRQCFEWLIEISTPARNLAKWYEQNSNKMFLPKELEYLRDKEILTIAEVATIKGCQEQSIRRFIRQPQGSPKRLVKVIDPATGKKGIRFEELERVVLSDLPYGFPWFNRSKNIKYSDLILLIRDNEFDSTKPTSSTMFQLPSGMVYYWNLDTMVDRHELVEADGTPIRIRSHQFRHINETVAYKAGVERAWMNCHAGRTKTSQEESYDDRTDAEKVAQASVVSVHQRVFGNLVALEPNLPKTEEEIMAEVGLMKRTGYVHVTDKGCCKHNFVDKPCSEFRDCLFCEDHTCIKGVPLWDRNIRAEIATEEETLLHALEAADLGRYGVKEHIEELILPRVTYCRQVKTVLEDPQVPQGTQFGHAPKADPYDPLINAIRHHVEHGRKKGLDVSWIEHALERLQRIRSTPSNRPFLTGEGDL